MDVLRCEPGVDIELWFPEGTDVDIRMDENTGFTTVRILDSSAPEVTSAVLTVIADCNCTTPTQLLRVCVDATVLA